MKSDQNSPTEKSVCKSRPDAIIGSMEIGDSLLAKVSCRRGGKRPAQRPKGEQGRSKREVWPPYLQEGNAEKRAKACDIHFSA